MYQLRSACAINKADLDSVSTEIFDWGFLYLLVGKVRGTLKNEMEVQEF